MNYELFQPNAQKSIYLIDMKHEKWYFSELVEQSIAKHLKEHKKILILTNKTGYASGIFCTSCGHVPQCKQCSISIGYHEADNKLLYGLCSVCKSIYDTPKACESCHKETLTLYGLTTQKTKERVEHTFAEKPFVIQAQEASSFPKAIKTLEIIKTANIVIATYSIIPSEPLALFDVVIVLAADQSLSLPDYSVKETTFYNLYRTFQLFDTKFFIVQTYDTDHASIRYACKADEQSFLAEDKIFRENNAYPPYGELCIIKYNHENETSLHNAIQNLYKELLYLQQSYSYEAIEIYTSSPLVYKKFGKFYYHLVLKGKDIRPFMDIAFSKLTMAKRWYKIDWMADSLL